MINDGNPEGIKIGKNGNIVIDTVDKWGEQIDVDVVDGAAGQILWPIKATVQQYLFLDAPIQLFLKSDSAEDNAAGTGAHLVSGEYHDLNGFEQPFSLIPTGVSNVALPGTSVGVFRFGVDTSGSTNSNVGNLDIVDGGGNIYARINPAEGQTRISVYRIPNNRAGTVRTHRVSYAKTQGNNSATLELKVRKLDGTEVVKWPTSLILAKPEDIKAYFIGGVDLQPGEWVFWKCISVDANDTPLRGSFDIEMEVL